MHIYLINIQMMEDNANATRTRPGN